MIEQIESKSVKIYTNKRGSKYIAFNVSGVKGSQLHIVRFLVKYIQPKIQLVGII